MKWWMGAYGSSTAKRHRAWSNNRWCKELDLGTLNVKKFAAFKKGTVPKTVRRTEPKPGQRVWYQGTAALKSTQTGPQFADRFAPCAVSNLLGGKPATRPLPKDISSGLWKGYLEALPPPLHGV